MSIVFILESKSTLLYFKPKHPKLLHTAHVNFSQLPLGRFEYTVMKAGFMKKGNEGQAIWAMKIQTREREFKHGQCIRCGINS